MLIKEYRVQYRYSRVCYLVVVVYSRVVEYIATFLYVCDVYTAQMPLLLHFVAAIKQVYKTVHSIVIQQFYLAKRSKVSADSFS